MKLEDANRKLFQAEIDRTCTSLFGHRPTGVQTSDPSTQVIVRSQLGDLVNLAAEKVAVDPTRLSDAEFAFFLLEQELETLADLGPLSALSVSEALKSICPLFPFC